jgi:hypothetical protein
MRSSALAAALALLSPLSSPAFAQISIGNFSVTVSMPPACDLFVPAPEAVSNTVGIWQGNNAAANVSDPFSDVAALAGVSPYVGIANGGVVTYAPTHASKTFRILWGTVDADNSIAFVSRSGKTRGTLTGTDLMNAGLISAYGMTNLYLIIQSKTAFASVTLSEPSTSFEVSDIGYSASVPTCP